MRKTFIPLLLLLAASLFLASAAHAATIKPSVPGLPAVTVPLETELIGADEEEVGEDEWEEIEDEEEGDEWEEFEAGEEPPVECLLRSASAKAVVSAGEDKLRLTIRYTTFEPTEATIDYRMRGGKGSLHLPQVRQRLGEQGTVRITEPLSETQAERARAAHDFAIQFRIADAPRECRPLFIRHLTAKRPVHDQVVFRQDGSIFGGTS
jgi:hypothetical protein